MFHDEITDRLFLASVGVFEDDEFALGRGLVDGDVALGGTGVRHSARGFSFDDAHRL